MKPNQVYNLVNSIASQRWGKDYVTVTDTTTLASLGTKVFADIQDNGKDPFLGILVDRIGKTVIRRLQAKSWNPNLVRSSFEWGVILQKIDIKPLQAQMAKSYEIGDSNFGTSTLPSDFLKVYKPSIEQRFFKNQNVFKNTVTVPDNLYKGSFTDAITMGNFVEALMDSQTQAIQRGINEMEQMAIAKLIGCKMYEGNGVYNLLSLYNGDSANPITAEAALRSADFYKFAGKTMRDIIKYLDDESALFNADGEIRRTTPDELNIIMLSDFASGYNTYLQADTFHKELTELPKYIEVNYWQGTGKAAFGDFEDRSSIKVCIGKVTDPDAPNVGEDINISQSGIVAVYHDDYTIGITNLDKYAGADRNNVERYTCYTQEAMEGLYIDLSENAVVFIVADPPTEEPAEENTGN